MTTNLKLLKDKYNLTDLEVFKQETNSHLISFHSNKLKLVESTNTSGYAVRVIKNKKTGFAARYINLDSNLAGLEETINQAIEISNFANEVNLELPNKSEGFSKKPANNNFEKGNLIKSGEELIKKIHNEIGNILIDLSFETHNIKEELENTKDLKYLKLKSSYSFSITLRETLENDFIEIYDAFIDDKLPNYNVIANDISKLYRLSKKHAKIKNGKCPVLFTSKAAKDLFHIIELSLSGKQVIEKSSPWHNKFGSQVLSKKITIRQDPSFGYMARNLDQEGSKIMSLNLINNGILENFYFDLMWSCKSKEKFKSTGNGFRPSLEDQVEPQLLNMIISSGEKNLTEIIEKIDYGLIVDQTIGALTTSLSGDFSANVDLGFLVEKGEIIGRVKDTMISGNIYDVLNNVIELSNEPKWHYSHIYNPDILVEGFHVTSK